MGIWDYWKLIILAVASIALYFNIITIIKKIYKGEETFKDTIRGGLLLAYIVLSLYISIQEIFKYI